MVKGVVTNMPHVRSCIANPAFKSGVYDTAFIPTYYGGTREWAAGGSAMGTTWYHKIGHGL